MRVFLIALMSLIRKPSKADKIQDILNSEVIPTCHLPIFLDGLVRRTILRVQGRSGNAAWENWAIHWLSGEDKTAKAVSVLLSEAERSKGHTWVAAWSVCGVCADSWIASNVCLNSWMPDDDSAVIEYVNRVSAKIKAKGIHRDPVRSSQSHFVKASGLRWLSLMLLAPIPWAHRVWALPFLTALCPSERYYEKRVRGHKKLTDWASQMLFQVRRWLPGRQLVVLADASFAALDFLWRVTKTANLICLITRFRLDAALYDPAPARKEGQKARPRKKGARLPTLEQILDDPETVWRKLTIPDWYAVRPADPLRALR